MTDPKPQVGDVWQPKPVTVIHTKGDNVQIQFCDGSIGWVFRERILANATLVKAAPRPFKVDDRVVFAGIAGLDKLTIIGIDGDVAWVKLANGDRSTRFLSNLRHADEAAP